MAVVGGEGGGEGWDNVYHTNQLEAGVGPGRDGEESQLVCGRQPSGRLRAHDDDLLLHTEPRYQPSALREQPG